MPRKTTLAKCIEHRTHPGGKAYLELLKEAIEDWKEEAVGLEPDEILKVHGAILRVRELIKEIERPLVVQKQRSGGYT